MKIVAVLVLLAAMAYVALACGSTECRGKPLSCTTKPKGFANPRTACFGSCSLFCNCARNKGASFLFNAFDENGQCVKFGDAFKQLPAALKTTTFNLAKQSCERLNCVCPSIIVDIPAGDARRV